MSSPAWLTEPECHTQHVYWQRDANNKQILHCSLSPSEWQDLLFTLLNSDNKSCFFLCVKYLPHCNYDYLIDLFLAETPRTLKSKIEYFKNEHKENISYNHETIYFGNKLAKRFYCRMANKAGVGNLEAQKFEVAKQLSNAEGLPNYNQVTACLTYVGKKKKQQNVIGRNIKLII